MQSQMHTQPMPQSAKIRKSPDNCKSKIAASHAKRNAPKLNHKQRTKNERNGNPTNKLNLRKPL